MIGETEEFKKLLSIKTIEDLFLEVGETVRTDIDFNAKGYNLVALKNTIALLSNLNLIEKEDDHYIKKHNLPREAFLEAFRDSLFEKYKETIQSLFIDKTHYDSESKSIYVIRNSIPLAFAGLLMLLSDLEETTAIGNRVIISGRILKSLIKAGNDNHRLSLSSLEKQLLKQKELGEQAEQYILVYEEEKLKRAGITSRPYQISHYDVTAGYDIVSYFSDKANDEKYIEVKSCDNKYEFHFSNNEIDTAKAKRERYYLYLYNRSNNTVEEIPNPYELFFESDEKSWGIEPDGYKIKKI